MYLCLLKNGIFISSPFYAGRADAPHVITFVRTRNYRPLQAPLQAPPQVRARVQAQALALRAQLTRQTASGTLVAVIDGLSPAESFKGV